jgi:hypothetical protein
MKNSQISGRESVASTQLDTLDHRPERFDPRPGSTEGAARAAIDSRASRIHQLRLGLTVWGLSRPVRH